jgi:putative serine protease PepD
MSTVTNQRPHNSRRMLWCLLCVSFFAGALGGLAFTSVVGTPKGSTTIITTLDRITASTDGATGQRRGLTAAQVYRRDASGVVYVTTTSVTTPQTTGEYARGEGGDEATMTGSGIEIDGSGDIVTNLHVVQDATTIMVGGEHKHTIKARIAERYPAVDIAVIRIPSARRDLHPLTLGDSNTVKVGDEAFVIGNPFDLGDSLSAGIISGANRKITAPNGATINDALQTDAPVNPGNSGGPLVNAQGEVIGIISQIETGDGRGGSVGIAFAIPINAIKQLVNRLSVRQ